MLAFPNDHFSYLHESSPSPSGVYTWIWKQSSEGVECSTDRQTQCDTEQYILNRRQSLFRQDLLLTALYILYMMIN